MTLTLHALRSRIENVKRRGGCVAYIEDLRVEMCEAFDTIWDYARRLEQARDADAATRTRLESRIAELESLRHAEDRDGGSFRGCG